MSVVLPTPSRSVVNLTFILSHLPNEVGCFVSPEAELMAEALNANCTLRTPLESHSTACTAIDAGFISIVVQGFGIINVCVKHILSLPCSAVICIARGV